MLAVLHAAADSGWTEQVLQLAEAMYPFCQHQGYLDMWLDTTDLGVKAARRAHDPSAEMRLRFLAAQAWTALGRLDLVDKQIDALIAARLLP